MTDVLTIPADLKPADGRFGAGPSKIQTSHLDALAATGSTLMGTSHRQAPVRQVVGRVRDGLAAFFSMPADYEVVLGNGGATAFWDVATYGLIREKSQHLSFGEFSAKFASAAKAAPWLAAPSVIASDPGSRPVAAAEEGVDVYAWAHNETSTAVMAPVVRPAGTTAPGCDARGYLVSGIAGRRTLIEGWAYTNQAMAKQGNGGRRYTEQPSPWPDRVALMDQALTAPTAEVLRRMRDEFGVRWLYADLRNGAVSPALDQLAVRRHSIGKVRIYDLGE